MCMDLSDLTGAGRFTAPREYDNEGARGPEYSQLSIKDVDGQLSFVVFDPDARKLKDGNVVLGVETVAVLRDDLTHWIEENA